MADVSKIKLPNGTTYDIKDTTSGYTTNTGTITKVQTTAGAHTTINVSSGAAAFNVPTKTSHLTNDSGFLTSVANDSHNHSPDTIYIPTNYARTGSVDLFSATKIGSYMSNKSFAIPPEAITIEYSTNGGSTWQDYGATDLHKRGLFAETRKNCNTYLGKATTKEANSLNNQLRITISRINLGRYTAINSFYTWMSTNGNTVYCKLERSLNSSPTVFETVFTDFRLAGWSGHNIRYFPTMALGGGNDNQPYAIRLTVWQTEITTNYPSANLYDIRFYGPDTYSASAPYYKVQTNELYTWDNALNAIFPAGITATSFSGNLTGNVTGNVSGSAGSVAWSGVSSKPTTISGYGITDAKIASGTITLGSNTITPLTSSSTLNAAKLSGAIPSAVTATTQASTDNSTKIATTAYVTTAITNLPEPMIFKGSVGTGGTITSLPTAAASNEGYTYKVITALSSPSAKVGDTVISNGSEWIVIPSGDEPNGTVTSVGISNGGGLSVSGSPVTSSGTITVSHADTSSQASSSNSGRTYIQSLTLDTYGHVTGISTATETVTDTNTWRTIQVNGTDVLGSGTGTGKLNLKAGSNVSVTNSSGTVTIAATDTTYESKAAASGGTAVSLVTTGEKYTWNNKIGATTPTIAANTGTSAITLASAGKYKLTAGGGSVIFTMPTIPTVPSNIVNTITTTAGTHTAISSKTGSVSFNIPTKTSHLTNDSNFVATTKSGEYDTLTVGTGTYTGQIKLEQTINGNDYYTTINVSHTANRTLTLPDKTGTVALTSDIPTIPTNVSAFTNDAGYTTNTGTVTGIKINGTTKSPSSGVVDLGTVATSDTNTTYTLSGALSSHKFTSTITAGGSGSGTSTSDFTLAAGSNVTLTDNTSTRTITIAATDTTYSSQTAASGGTALSLVTTGEKYTWNNKSNLTIGTTSTTAAAGNHTHTASLATSTGTSSITLASAGKYALTAGGSSVIFTMPTIPANTDTKVTVAENTKTTKYYPILATGTGTATRQIDTNDKLNSETASGLYYQNAILGTPGLYVGDIEYTITNDEYAALDAAIDAIL